jgi:hypothetical protein
MFEINNRREEKLILTHGFRGLGPSWWRGNV